MSDIVEWLRKEAELIALDRLNEAADEIERLRAELATIAQSAAQNLDADMLRAIARRALEPKP